MTTYFLNILQGLLVTIGVAFGALVFASALGLAGAAAKLSPYRALNLMGDIYTTVIRGVPDLVWMLLLYFGGQILVNDIAEALGYSSGPQINPFVAGVLTIGFVYGAYMTETFRGAIMSVPKGQSEAGWAFGMSRFYTFRRMVLPQMVRFALPSFTNNWLVLLKSTALVSVIGLADITNLAKQAGAAARGEIPGAAIIFMAFAGFLYLMISSISLLLLRKAEARYSVGVKRGTF
jgi:arginine/ornithine transport system permease protein